MEEFFEMMEHHHSILDFRVNVKVFRPSTLGGKCNRKIISMVVMLVRHEKVVDVRIQKRVSIFHVHEACHCQTIRSMNK